VNRKEYRDKLKKWEAEGYNVSELRQKWFPAKSVIGSNRFSLWISVIAAVFVIVVGIVVWQTSQPTPAPAPVSAPSPSQATEPTTTPTPTPTTTPPTPEPLKIIQYILTTSCNPVGSGSISPSGGNYDAGSKVQLNATPDFGYRFSRWSGDITGSNQTTWITVDKATNVIAYFEPISYSLSTVRSPPEGGSISPAAGQYESGEQVILTAVPSLGWAFDRWSGTNNNSNNPSSVTMDSDKKVTAYFVVKDTDGDGLSDIEEQQIGTNPKLSDTDGDGLNDHEEVKVKKTDPLIYDTDRDGVPDGKDLFPLYDARVRVAITYFESTGTLNDQWGYQEAYFYITVNGMKKGSSSLLKELISGKYLRNPYSATFDIPDATRYVSVSIEAWEDDDFNFNDHYDINGDSSQLEDYATRYDVMDLKFTDTSDGATDGDLQGCQGKITVEISTID
jgi:hypothetical protein